MTPLPTEANAETPSRTLRLRLLSKIAELRHNADKQMKAAQRRYKRHHDAQVQEEAQFHVGPLVYVNYPALLTSTRDKMAAEAYTELLPRAVGPYFVISTTSYIISLDQDGVPNTIPADSASRAPMHMQLKENIVDDEHHQSLSETFVRDLGKVTAKQAKEKIREINHKNTVYRR